MLAERCLNKCIVKPSSCTYLCTQRAIKTLFCRSWAWAQKLKEAAHHLSGPICTAQTLAAGCECKMQLQSSCAEPLNPTEPHRAPDLLHFQGTEDTHKGGSCRGPSALQKPHWSQIHGEAHKPPLEHCSSSPPGCRCAQHPCPAPGSSHHLSSTHSWSSSCSS